MKEIGYLNFKDMRKSSLYIIISLLFCNLSCTEYLDVKNKGEVIPETAEEFSALLHRHLYCTGLESMLFSELLRRLLLTRLIPITGMRI